MSLQALFQSNNKPDQQIKCANSKAQGFIYVGSGNPDVSSQLDLDNPLFLLCPRLTQAEINALTPTDGHLVYNTTDAVFQFRQNGSWITISSGSGSIHVTSTADSNGYTDTTASISTDGGLSVAKKINPKQIWVNSVNNSAFTPSASCDDIVIVGTAEAGLQVNSSNTGEGLMCFGPSDGTLSGGMSYQHSADTLTDSISLVVAGSPFIKMQNDASQPYVKIGESYQLQVDFITGSTAGSPVVYMAAPIQFQNATVGYSASDLSYYEGPLDQSLSFTGAFSSSTTFSFVRIGVIVIVRISQMLATSTTGAALSNAGGIPARFRPTADTYITCLGRNSSADTAVTVRALTNGNVVIYNGVSSSGVFTGSGQAGIYVSTISWPIV